MNFVKSQPEFGAACDPSGLDAADMTDNFGPGRQVKAAACFEGLERLDLEDGVFLRALGA